MFYLYHHNDLARLAELFSVLRRQHQRAPLAVDTVLAPNAGIGRWLRIQLTASDGVAAGLHGQLPGEFIWQLLHAVMAGADDGDHFESGCLLWHLYTALPEMGREISAVADYLGPDCDEVRRYQLAAQLNDVFNQYLIYRADMLQAWENGHFPASNPGHWQAQVWFWLTRRNRLGNQHRARILSDFITQLREDTTLQKRVRQHCPPQLYCFSLVALPPDQLRLLYALADLIDIHFMLPNPSAVYWGDLVTGRLPLALPDNTHEDDNQLPGESLVEINHPLLSRLGRMARDTLRLLYSDEFADMVDPELGEAMDYAVPDADSLLHRIQADIVQLDCHDSPQGMTDDDTSLEIHACHSPLREIQVLQDQLLDRLATDDDRVANGDIRDQDRLAPRDIIVMIPNVADYAPAIQAVFGGAPADRYLPFGLADRARSATHPIVTRIASLLDLPLWRWTASQLMDLLATPAVMRRFGLTADELDTLSRWLTEAGVRWGRNQRHRAELGAGAYEQNSWQFGLDRLLLGAIQSDDETLIDGVAPWSDLEGGMTQALGKLWRFENTLGLIADDMVEPATAGAWQTRLNNMLDSLVEASMDEPDEQRAVDSLRRVFAGLETAERCTQDKPLTRDRRLSWEAVRDDLRATLNTAAERQPFLAGGITFCGMVPLRAVPFRMVCILGLNDTTFPRQDEGRAFNVMFDEPRLGDRNMRDDDRLLFLQALTAARDSLHISYIGQSAHTGDILPPSPIVGETLEFIHNHYFRDWDISDFEQRLIHRQPMQPFSPRYFSRTESDPRVFTHANEWREASQASLDRPVEPALWLDEQTAPMPENIELIDLATLSRFFDNPARFFCRERLGLSLELEESNLEDEEPIQLDSLSAYQLRSRLLASAEQRELAEIAITASDLERARGTLPPPPLADVSYAEQVELVNQLLPIWQQWHAEGSPQTLDIQLDDLTIVEPENGRTRCVRLAGRVPQCWPGVLRRLRVGKLKTRYRLRYWIEYLAAVASGHELTLQMAGFAPQKGDELTCVQYTGHIDPAAAREKLIQLIQLYMNGQTHPLAFHPDLADEYNPRQNKPLANLSYRFKPGIYRPHHLMDNPYFTMLLGSSDAPLGRSEQDNPFIDLMTTITEPMNACVSQSEVQ